MQNLIEDTFGTPESNPKLSVIVVCYNTGLELIDCLNSLKQQTEKEFETILIDNANIDIKELNGFNLRYIHTGDNLGPSKARNIGTNISKSDIIAFLDDDAIADKYWVSSMIKSLQPKDVIGVRGKVVPKKSRFYNLIAYHYNLGGFVKPWYIDLEGNCGFKKKEYIEAGGFDNKLFGGEGIELTYRLFQLTKGATIYDPSIIIAHDYADSLWHFINKSYRNGKNHKKQTVIHNDYLKFLNKFNINIKTHNVNIVLRIIQSILYIIDAIAFNLGMYCH